MSLYWLGHDEDVEFPPLAMALDEPDGLLAAGGDLSTARLLAAYQRGIFPWYSEGQPILWWSPDPRMILVPSQFHTSRSLARCRRRGDWRFSINTAFAQVIDACAAPRDGQDGTWITAEMRAAYLRLHAQGWAHSLEVWQDDNIAGGIYGLAIDRCFFGESMFHCVSNASKLALAALCERLAADEFVLLDCQMHTAHLATLGAQLMPRAAFAAQLEQYCKRLKPWQPAPI